MFVKEGFSHKTNTKVWKSLASGHPARKTFLNQGMKLALKTLSFPGENFHKYSKIAFVTSQKI